MKRIWAPWRLEYVRSAGQKKAEGSPCLFCSILAQKPDVSNLLLALTEHWGVVLNRYPFSNGHLLVVPKAHVSTIAMLDKEHHQSLGAVLSLSEDVLKACFSPHGFNVGANIGKIAGAGVPDHLHFHVVPRWSGDTNFMPVLAEVRCINDHIVSMYERLRPFFEKSVREVL